MNKAIRLAADLWLRLVVLSGRVFNAGRAWVSRLCACESVSSRELFRAAAAGAILCAVAGAGYGARGTLDPYVAPSAAGATVTIGWESTWPLTALLGALLGAAAGAGATFLARMTFPRRGAATALLAVGVLGGTFAGATWGRAVARERVLEVKAQPANRPATAKRGGGTALDIVSGPVRLTGSVDRGFNVPMLGFMLVAGAGFGLLTARGLEPRRSEEAQDAAAAQPARRRPAQPTGYQPGVPVAA